MSEPVFETGPLERVRFVERLDRFRVAVVWRGAEHTAFVANPGKMGELLLPEVDLLARARPDTRTGLEVVGADWQSRWPGDWPRTVLLDTGRINDVVAALLERRQVPALADATIERRETRLGDSRIDFFLERAGRPYLLEVKSCTWVEQGQAMFPDARSARALHHLELLAKREGDVDAGVLFLVQGRAERFLPDVHNDPGFAAAFKSAGASLDVHAVACEPRVDDTGRLSIGDTIHSVEVDYERLDELLRLPAAELVVATRETDAREEHHVWIERRDASTTRRRRPALLREILRGASRRLRLPLRVAHPAVDRLAEDLATLEGSTRETRTLLEPEDPVIGEVLRLPQHPLRTTAFQEAWVRYRVTAGAG